MKKTVSKTGMILLAILLVGVCVLLYPSFSQYWNSRTQSRAVENYREILDSLTEDQYAELFDQAAAYNASLESIKNPLWHYDQVEGYRDNLNVSGTGIMGYVTIEKLGVELPIYHGTSPDILNDACGHLEGSSLPIGGPSTHSVLSAHRGLPHAKLFTDLDKLEIGDTFVITILDRTVTYMVDQVKTVRPDQTEDLEIVKNEDYCTLLTCTPYGINSHRMLVRGHRVENEEVAAVIHVTADALQVDTLIVACVLAVPMLLLLTLYVFISDGIRRKK